VTISLVVKSIIALCVAEIVADFKTFYIKLKKESSIWPNIHFQYKQSFWSLMKIVEYRVRLSPDG